MHYPIELALNIQLRKWDKIYIYAIVYSVATACQILVLLHYLGCLWIYIGSSSFEDYEVDHEPWILANDDLKEMSKPQLFVFSTYWICTVITTVGYGDYSGGTSLEYLFTLGVELFGFIIFAALEIAVLKLVGITGSAKQHILQMEMEADVQALLWLRKLELANYGQSIPPKLLREVKHSLSDAQHNDINLIQEGGFYDLLKPQLQSELVEYLFAKTIMREFSSVFSLCERGFVNRIIVSFAYRSFQHN